jgi:hypothetical protein
MVSEGDNWTTNGGNNTLTVPNQDLGDQTAPCPNQIDLATLQSFVFYLPQQSTSLEAVIHHCLWLESWIK